MMHPHTSTDVIYTTPIIIPHIKQHEKTNHYQKSRTSASYLNAEVVQKMLLRFFNETQMPKETLAKTLGITRKSLEKLSFHKEPSMELIRKINLPLIHLYCKTRFNGS
jgi:hypothetical protein